LSTSPSCHSAETLRDSGSHGAHLLVPRELRTVGNQRITEGQFKMSFIFKITGIAINLPCGVRSGTSVTPERPVHYRAS
jgi:hypothetical protein